MYHVTTWNRDGSRQDPCLTTVQTLPELFTRVYEAGIGNKGIVVQEFDYDDTHGERLDVLFDTRTTL